MKLRMTLEIDLDSDAFQSPTGQAHETRAHVGRLLQESIEYAVEHDGERWTETHALRDINGNTCGRVLVATETQSADMCAACGGNIEGGPVSIEYAQAVQLTHCHECNTLTRDVYALQLRTDIGGKV